MNNYVKFMRGTPKAFNALAVKDINTLYFISEVDAASGKLYLGEKEIICDNNTIVATYLSDLLDVSLPKEVEIKDGQVLTYDADNSKWVARDPSGIAEVLFDDNQFELTADGELSVLNFANAESGAQLTKSAEGKLVWIKPDTNTVEGLSTAVETLRSDVDALNSKIDELDTPAEIDTKISEAIAAVNHLSYKIVESVDYIDVSAQDAAKFIYLVKNNDIYDEYMVVNGTLEKVGDWNVDLSSYATKNEVSAVDDKVVDIASRLNGVDEAVQSVNSKITSIETSVSDLGTQLGSLGSDVVDLTAELNNVKEQVEINTSAIGSLEEAIEAIEEALDNKVDATAYSTKMAEIDEDMAEMKATMSWNQLDEPEE